MANEVTDKVIDSPQSVVFDEENRLHVQKAIMLLLMEMADLRRKRESGDADVVKRSFDFAEDFGSGLIRPLNASTQNDSCLKTVFIERRREKRMAKKVVLAYSGGLDTSIIIPWLKEELWLRSDRHDRRCGTGRDMEAVEEEGDGDGREFKSYVEDLREEFVTRIRVARR